MEEDKMILIEEVSKFPLWQKVIITVVALCAIAVSRPGFFKSVALFCGL